MASRTASCPACGAPVPAGVRSCVVCRAPIAVTPAGGEGAGGRSARAPENPFATDLNRRLARLAQWSEASEPLGVAVPRLPAWAEEAAVRSRRPEPWAEVVRAVERLAQRRIVEAFDRWEARTTARIGRLEAYAVDSRLERSQIEDAVHAARLGDVAQALATFQQVDRVVALKERHLDQARGELEGLLAFLRDLESLGVVDAAEPGEVAGELERELRNGRLAPLKRRLRLLRTQAVERLTEALPSQVREVGDRLAADPGAGRGREPEAFELAVATRTILAGRAEDGVRRLRALREARGLATPPTLAPRGATSEG
jgi:hypothetical protein